MEKNLIPILESENPNPWGTLIGITNTCTRFLVAQYFKTIKGVGLLIPQFVQLIRLSRCHKDVTKEWNKQCIYIFDMILTESTSTRKCHFVTYMEGSKEAEYYWNYLWWVCKQIPKASHAYSSYSQIASRNWFYFHSPMTQYNKRHTILVREFIISSLSNRFHFLTKKQRKKEKARDLIYQISIQA